MGDYRHSGGSRNPEGMGRYKFSPFTREMSEDSCHGLDPGTDKARML